MVPFARVRLPAPLRLSRLFACASAALLSAFSVPAHADNPDRFYMSSDAALQAGAITADSQDSASVWYNPAGLARATAFRFDVNVSAYALQLGGVPSIDTVGTGAKQENVSVLNFSAVPTSVASINHFKNLSAGFGVFVPQMGVNGLRTRVTQEASDTRFGLELDINSYRTTQEMFAGPGIGYHLGPGVDVGMALFVHYRAILETDEARVLVTPSEGNDVLVSSRELADWLQLGVAATFGVQVRLAPRWRYGMLLRLPSLRVLQLLGYSRTMTTVAGGEILSDAEFTDETKVATRFLTPARMNAGLSYDHDKVHLALEGSYQMPFRNSETSESLRPTLNVRMGARGRVKKNMELGGGFYTNMSTQKRLQVLGDAKVNFYGITLATQLGTPYLVSQREGQVLKKPSKMNFGSSFAFSYAIGVGQVIQGQVGSLTNPAEFYRETPARVVAHEWIFSVGGSLFEQ